MNASRGEQTMSDPKPAEAPELTAKTQKLPAIHPRPQEDSEEFLAQQEDVRLMIAANDPLSEVLTKLVLMIEAQAPNMVASILLLSYDGNHVRHAVAPSLPQSYVKVIDGSPIGPKNGSCGTAMFRGEPVMVTDILTDPLWDDYREHAMAIGMRSCWSTPIMSSKGKVLGSFAMYHREPRGPNDREQHLTEVATKLAAEAIEHKLRASTNR
jgi:GAF domain-containing protein